jgi:hypothetical protein
MLGMVQRLVQRAGEKSFRTYHEGEARRASGHSVLQATPGGQSHSRHRYRFERNAEAVSILLARWARFTILCPALGLPITKCIDRQGEDPVDA